MAFLDGIGRAFTNAGQKTRDMADIARFNSLLAEEEKKINAIYYQIGRMYVQLHPQDSEEALTTYVQACIETQKNIGEINARIRQLKNIINCPGCGTELSGDIAFCSVCGYRMPPRQVPVPDGMVRCANCGNFVPQNMRFCSGCGSPIQAAPVAPMPPFAPVPPVATAAPVAPDTTVVPDTTVAVVPEFPVATCSSCNSPLEPDCAFCVVCGAPVGSDSAAPAEKEASACPNCGAPLDSDSVFCIECGTKIS